MQNTLTHAAADSCSCYGWACFVCDGGAQLSACSIDLGKSIHPAVLVTHIQTGLGGQRGSSAQLSLRQAKRLDSSALESLPVALSIIEWQIDSPAGVVYQNPLARSQMVGCSSQVPPVITTAGQYAVAHQSGTLSVHCLHCSHMHTTT